MLILCVNYNAIKLEGKKFAWQELWLTSMSQKIFILKESWFILEKGFYKLF